MIKNKKRIIGSIMPIRIKNKNSLQSYYERQQILKSIVQELNKLEDIKQTKWAN